MRTVRVGLATCLEGIGHDGPRGLCSFGLLWNDATPVGVWHEDKYGRDEMQLSAGVGPGVWEGEVQPWIESLHRREPSVATRAARAVRVMLERRPGAPGAAMTGATTRRA